MKVLIKNGLLWMESGSKQADLLVENGRILKIGAHIEDSSAAQVDAASKYVLPGAIDVHTHMELPVMGTESKDDFFDGTRAALYGGTTTIIDFANQTKGESLQSCVDLWHKKAESKVCCDYGLHVSVTDVTPEVLKEMESMISQGITSFKTFLAYPNMMISLDALEKVMSKSKELGGITTLHAELGEQLIANLQKIKKAGQLSHSSHPVVHSRDIEIEAAKIAIEMANKIDAHLYIVHTTCKECVDFAKDYSNIYIETCPHYLFFTEDLYKESYETAAQYIMSPPLRTKKDQDALWEYMKGGKIHVVATDHCTFDYYGQKDQGKEDYTKIPNGVAGVEQRLELLFSEGVLKNRITMEQLISLCSSAPARLFGLESKGELAEGKDADIVIFDPNKKHRYTETTHHGASDHNIYRDIELTGKVETVISKGEIVILDGNETQSLKAGRGEFVRRGLPNF